MLVSQSHPPGIELYSYANRFLLFWLKNMPIDHVSENTIKLSADNNGNRSTILGYNGAHFCNMIKKIKIAEFVMAIIIINSVFSELRRSLEMIASDHFVRQQFQTANEILQVTSLT